jgi:hypothetical protein
MSDNEDIEKVRQEIMRLRELLTLMRERLEGGERAYDKLFSSFLPAETATLKEKDRQWKLAEAMLSDLGPLQRAVSVLRFDARMLEQNFEELEGIIAATPKPE